MELYRIWRILFRHIWVLIWLPLAATCAGLAVTYVLPEQYASTALVLVRPFEDVAYNTAPGGPKRLPDFPLDLSGPVDAPSKTYIEVIKSSAVATQIVEALHLDMEKPKHFSSSFEELRDEIKAWIKSSMRTVTDYLRYGRKVPATPFEIAVQGVEKNLSVIPRKDTYAFDISYRAGDPNEAAAVANMAATIFLDQRAEAYRSEAARAGKFLKRQLDESRRALDQARAAILAYKKDDSTFNLTSEYNEQLKRLSDLQASLAKSRGRIAVLERTYRQNSPTLDAQRAEITELNQQISALESQLKAYPQKETELDALTLTEHLAKDNYEFLRKRYEEERVKEASDVSEIRVASRAMPGLYPIKPVKYVYAGLSFATALVVAIGWALLMHAVDPRVHTANDVDEALGLPVLGAIPHLKRSWWTVGT